MLHEPPGAARPGGLRACVRARVNLSPAAGSKPDCGASRVSTRARRGNPFPARRHRV